MRKKILFLGGSHFQLPPLVYAQEQGHYIITCDYLPGNPGHRYANEYYNVSTTDLETVLRLAGKLGVDGVVAYGSDPAAATAAYVCEQLGLPGNPYQAVKILTHKDLYRDFLRTHGFAVPQAAGFSLLTEAEKYFSRTPGPLILKPVDSSGSRGVQTIHTLEQLQEAFPVALQFSRTKRIILEERIQKKGYQIAGDGFVVNGRLAFRCFAQEHFIGWGDPPPPIAESYPLLLPQPLQGRIHAEIDRLVSLLGLRNGALNLDIMLNHGDDIYLIEIAPRAGGNLITEMIRRCTGVNLVKYVVDAALGLDCSELAMVDKAALCGFYVLHAASDGIFCGVEIDDSLRENVVEQKVFIHKGTPVQKYSNSSGTLGCLILKFGSADEMLSKMESMHERVRVVLA